MGRALLVYADGGSRGNPGVAGYGAVVLDAASGDLLAERAEPLGLASNNVAEYSGLIAGLHAAATIDPGADVEVRLDSKLVVEQLSGRWKIKHEDMRRLALQARELSRSIEAAGGSVTYAWVPRAENTAADRLSNVAMDGESVSRDLWLEDADAQDAPADDPSVNPASAGIGAPVRAPVIAQAMGTGAGRPDRGAVTRIVLVRHGVTSFTEEARLDGRGGLDPSLSERGREQARRAAESVSALVAGVPTRVVTSSLARAVETGAFIADALAVDPEVDADFDEQGFGDWDGAAIADLLQSVPHDLLRFRDDPTYARPGGESHLELQERVSAAYERVVGAGGTTVVVSHRKAIMCVMAHVLGLTPAASWRLAAAPGSLHAIEVWEDGTTSVAFTNRT
ncbi:bifunctional RNase H/acid phosphatase [Nostocoides sp. F2B08]|uniref:bifunctional RNase H/acid phosphatase n=1 Tax=Nostocoides sp. F2B08 TaxID=2653936 RepID=UPI0012638E2C|nr:bifunctional RNase H/acid phosphatase [Tetrasphaera sp. F2B08]KAB7744682.1 bifunctional RNase H/acid phosphatase [Tetrasphaera sp. F2B08]